MEAYNGMHALNVKYGIGSNIGHGIRPLHR
jgi:hypothetical protein